MESDHDLWSEIDRMRGVEAPRNEPAEIGPVAFYWRVSTEDRQSPEDSRLRQLQRAVALIEPLGGHIVEEYSDVGISRSMPWTNRPGAARLLGDLRRPAGRAWQHLVIGEGDRAFYGDQFSQVWPRFESANVEIYMPEIGGRYDPSQPLSKTMMSVQGAMSEAEVAQVRRRVRETMAALVVHEGRHMGGRAPYGYAAVNSDEPHPNPKFAAEGRFKRILVVDPEAAEVVQRIFNLYISGMGQRAIAKTLNADSIPCPSAHRPEQNTHRLQDGWQTSTIEAILRNDKYTGYYLWGAFERARPLLDPENPSLGWELRHRRAPDHKRVRSRSQAHEPIIPMHIFREAQTVRARRSSTRKRDERTRVGRPKYVAIFRGTLRCGICNRKMHPCRTGTLIRYQCRARDLAPGSSVANEHPITVNLKETVLKEKVDVQLLRFFAPENREQTLRDLIASQDGSAADELQRKREQREIAETQRDARNLVEAVAKSGGSQMLLDALAKAEGRLAELITNQTPEDDTELLDESQVRAWLDRIDFDVAAMLATAEPQDLYEFHQAVGLQLVYNANESTCKISIGTTTGRPPASAGNHPVNSDRVRGGTRTGWIHAQDRQFWRAERGIRFRWVPLLTVEPCDVPPGGAPILKLY